jgi:UDP-N-acetylglucosamine/UDP-N-acetylgalactosamine diphosphorylase
MTQQKQYTPDREELARRLDAHGQAHVLRFWPRLSAVERRHLAAQVASVDFDLIDRLVKTWVLSKPEPQHFTRIEPVDVLPVPSPGHSAAREALAAGEAALRAGRVGLVLVAGGQGTRLGFPGPKGTFPIGPVTGRTLFEYHADRILHTQRAYGCVLPWYIMVGDTNEAATRRYFEDHGFLGLDPANVFFFTQAMMPSVDESGRMLLDSPSSLAMNPNGHGGCIPALVDEGIIGDARRRGIDTLSYFQVDNWAINLADPYFIGYHVLRNGEFSSKVKRKTAPREAAGVFCLCDGKVRVLEYTELDIYPQLLDTDAQGALIHFAGNAAAHVIGVEFIERIYAGYDRFPWHCSHKKIAHVNEAGERVQPDRPNGYKFETFVFDALVYASGRPLTLEIDRVAEFALAKQMSGPGGVDEARANMNAYWGGWLRAAGCTRALDGVNIEISPVFASSAGEFVGKARDLKWPVAGDIAIDAAGRFV